MRDISAPTLARAACVAVIVAAFLGGCSTIQVTTEYDRSARFDGLSSYAWAPQSETERTDPLLIGTPLDSRIRTAVDVELAKRGYRPVAGGTPDFLVAYHAALARKIDLSSMRRGAGRRVGYADPMTRTYDEGTLLIDVLEPGSQRLLWRGVGRAEVHRISDPAKREQRLREAVAKILERFPPE